MARPLFVALALLAAPVVPVGAAEADALAAIDTCIERLDPQVDVGYDRIARRCPNLAPTLEKSGWAAWLPQGWKDSRNDLSAGSLKELRELVSRELATRAATHTVRVERLKQVLADLGATGEQRSGVWARFKQWVRSLFERAGRQNRGSWLDRLIARAGVSGAVIQITTFVALGLVIALAAVIIFNELRVAGILGPRRKGLARARASAAERAARLDWSDVERAPLLERPRLVLELITAKLTDLGRLPPAGAFTVRELVRAADLSQASDRDHLRELALVAERARYGSGVMAPSLVETALASARELLTHLESRDVRRPAPAGAGV